MITHVFFIVDRSTNSYSHKYFYDIIDELDNNDVLVVNNTRVMPARLLGVKEETNAVIELLLLPEQKNQTWDALVKPGRRVKEGTIVTFGEGLLKAKCVAEKAEGIKSFEMIYDGIFYEILEQLGQMPLPPYIHEKLDDKERYQTVYAKEIGSAAAPTAGLHFTKPLLEKINAKNIEIIEVTLHVGLGTFRPTQAETIEEHHMHKETYLITETSAKRLNAAYQSKKRIVAVGTTSVRTLESNFNGEVFTPGLFETQIFIYPGYQFRNNWRINYQFSFT